MIASLAAVALPTGFGGSSRPPPIEEETPPAEATPNALSFPHGPGPTIDGTKPHIAIIKTKAGDIKIQLATDAPKAVNSFAFLAGHGFYDGATFFYVNKDFVAQTGDPTCRADAQTLCSGVGGPGYTLPLEQSSLKHDQWAVAALTLGEGGQEMHGSQFRILYQPDQRLDGQETVFGRVVDPDSQKILESLNNLELCSIVSAASCAKDLSSALVIDEILVEQA